MPLNAAKIAHVKLRVAETHAGREQQVILTCRNADGTTSTLTVNAIWRVMGDWDATVQGAGNQKTHSGAEAVINAMFLQADVSLGQLRSVLYAQLGSDATGAQVATRFTLLDIEPIGMMPGGDRFFTTWAKQH